MTKLQPQVNLNERVYELLRQRMLTRHPGPGAKLSLHELAAELGVSRSPVHHALTRLVSEGLLSVKARHGYFVTPVTATHLVDSYEVRGAFELRASKDGARLAGLTHPQRFENYPGFAVKPLAGYRYFTGSSEVCGIFGTDPVQPGATVTAKITGPGVSGPAEKVSRAGSLGEGSFTFGIVSYGTYTVTLTVTAGGLTRTTTSTVVVTEAPGTCPG